MQLDEKYLFLSFRYALGRKTYVAQEVAEELINKWHHMSDRYKVMIIKEIKQAIESNRAGSMDDVHMWEKVLELGG